MNIFVHVACAGSFAGAGRELGLSSSAIGKSIARLEARVGVRLLRRSTRSLTLTEEGMSFLLRCQGILAEVEAAHTELSQAAGVPQGLLRISLPQIGEPFLSQLVSFQERYPAVELELQFSNRHVDLVQEGFDAALRTGTLADSRLNAKPLLDYRMSLVASPDYFARRGVPATPADLVHHDRLRLRLPNTGKFQQPLFFDAGDAVFDERARTSLSAGNTQTLIEFTRRGAGIAYLPDALISTLLASGEVLPVLSEFAGESNQFHLVWASGRHIPPRLRVFIAFLSEQFSAKNAFIS
jgi:DNA-binding transcriptional LysR family regulator